MIESSKFIQMRLKIVLTFILSCIYVITFSQDYKDTIESVKNIDTKIEEGAYKTDETVVPIDKLIVTTFGQNSNFASNEILFLSDKEWEKIKNTIKKNKERVIKNNEIFISKVIDTVYLMTPVVQESRISGSSW